MPRGLILLVVLMALPASASEVYKLERITVQSPADESIRALDENGQVREYVTARGRFYDLQGVPFKPSEGLSRGDELVVVYRATDDSRTVLNALRCRTAAPAAADRTPPMGGPHKSPSGLSVTVATGWVAESEEERVAVLYKKAPTAFVGLRILTDPGELDGRGLDSVPEGITLLPLAEDVVDLGGQPFTHFQGAALMQGDRGMVWVDVENRDWGRAASPMQELWLVDTWIPQGAAVPTWRATSLVAVADYPKRIPEVRAMVASVKQ